MTPLSDRHSDAFDNPAKMACRSGNLRVLREAAYLLWEDSNRARLRCDWCELMGQTGLLTLELLERERQWFEILMLTGLSPGASPAYQVRMMLVERCRWLRN